MVAGSRERNNGAGLKVPAWTQPFEEGQQGLPKLLLLTTCDGRGAIPQLAAVVAELRMGVRDLKAIHAAFSVSFTLTPIAAVQTNVLITLRSRRSRTGTCAPSLG